MPTKIARMDALAQAQVTTITPVAANTTVYTASINTKQLATYLSTGAATISEIVNALQPLLQAAIDAEIIPEVGEIDAFTEDNLKITATGLDTGKPFTIASTGAGTLTIATPTVAKSKNHWIAENFDGAGLPANADTVVITQLTEDQSILYDLDQSAITLALLSIRHDSSALIGLDEYDDNGYYQYRGKHLKINADVVQIGQGEGDGSRRVNLDLGVVATEITVFQTAAFGFDNDAPVHLIAANAANNLLVLSGIVDVGTKAGTAGQYLRINVTNGAVQVGPDVTVQLMTVSGGTLTFRKPVVGGLFINTGAGLVTFIGEGTLPTIIMFENTTFKIIATGDITINGITAYSGATLDLSECIGEVSVVATVNASGDNPFTVLDPNNKMTMSGGNWSINGGVQAVNLITGPAKGYFVETL